MRRPKMTSTISPTMRAWTHTAAGTPSKVLSLTPNLTTPTLKSSKDVLVRITHASLSPGASIMMQLCPSVLRAKPAIPELDFSGIIVQVGSDVPASRELRAGVPVFGSVLIGLHISAGVGALAEYIALPATSVVRKPENVSMEKAAGFGVSGCTALVLMDGAKIQKGDKVLVNGASGGVGSIVVQFPKEAVGEEGKVVAMCSGRNVEMVKELGADEVIDYVVNAPVHKHLATKYAKIPFDVIIDAYGVQELFNHCPSYLAPGKPFVTVGIAPASYSISSLIYASSCMLQNMLWPRLLGGVNRAYLQITALASLAGLEKLAELAEEGCFEVAIDLSWDMEDVLKGYERMLSKRARGKIIIKIRDP